MGVARRNVEINFQGKTKIVPLAVLVGVATLFFSQEYKLNFMTIIPVAVTGNKQTVSTTTHQCYEYKGTGTTILVLYLMTDENARSFQVKKIRALKSALEMLVEKR